MSRWRKTVLSLPNDSGVWFSFDQRRLVLPSSTVGIPAVTHFGGIVLRLNSTRSEPPSIGSANDEESLSCQNRRSRGRENPLQEALSVTVSIRLGGESVVATSAGLVGRLSD